MGHARWARSVAAAALLLPVAGCTGGDTTVAAGADQTTAGPTPTSSTPTSPSPSWPFALPTGTLDPPSTELPTEPPTEPPPEPETEPPDGGDLRSFTVATSGDVLLHEGTWATARADASRRGRQGLDFSPMFAAMRPAIGSVDLAVCHLETPLADPSGPFSAYPIFSVPPQVVRGLQGAGYDACSTASNHSLDTGADGVVRTLRTLDRIGMPHFGTALSERASRTPFITTVAGVRVALLNYTYGTNGIPVPADRPWSVPLIDPPRIVADAARARREGAEVVLVGLHFGTEYSTAPDTYQRDVVDRITRSSDIDVVYGHHAHVPQPFDKVHGTWVAFGLGNFIAQQETSMPDTYRGITARFTFTERPSEGFRVSDVAFLPTLITPYVAGDPRMRVLDAAAALQDPGSPPVPRALLRQTVIEVRAAAESLGGGRSGLHLWRSWLD